MPTQLPSALLATAFAFAFFAAPAKAQAPRTFVSAAGSDSNPCSFAAPCRHFQTAVNATSAGGEVDALDPAGYGPIIISQAITIEGQGWSYIAPPANDAAITIDAVSGSVNIRGVSLNGVGIAGTTTGILFRSGASLTIENCVVRKMTSSGIAIAQSVSSKISVSNTLVSDNGGHGIYVQPHGNNLVVTALFNRVEVYNNSLMGIGIYSNAMTGTTSLLTAQAIDSVAATNGQDGYYALGNSSTGALFHLFRCTSFENSHIGVYADVDSFIVLAQSHLGGNAVDANAGTISGAAPPGAIATYGDNYSFTTIMSPFPEQKD